VFPSILLCLVLLLGCRGLVRWAGGREGKRGHAIEGTFFGVFALLGLISCIPLLRTTFHLHDFPKILLLLFALLGALIAWRLPRRFVWRKAPFFLAVLVYVCIYFIGMVKNYISEMDFFPVEHPGMRVVCHLDNPLASEPDDPKAAYWRRNIWLMKDFTGLVMATYQYSYITLSADNAFLYVNDFNLRGNAGGLFKVRLDDFQVVASVKNPGPYRDMLEDPETGQLIATSFLSEEVRYYRASDLALLDQVPVSTTAVLNLAKAWNGNLIVTSEPARVFVISPERKILQRHVLPIQLEDIALDKTGKKLIIGAIGGCTLSIMDLETMEIERERCLSMGTVDVSYDAGNGRIILPLTFKGDVEVLDFDTLETIATIPLAPGIRPVAYDPDMDVIIVGNYLSGYLHFIDGKTYRVLKTIWAGTRIRDIQYAPIRKRVYVCASLNVFEIDMKTFLGSHP